MTRWIVIGLVFLVISGCIAPVQRMSEVSA